MTDDPHDPTRPCWPICGARGEEFQREPERAPASWGWWLAGALVLGAVLIWSIV